MLHYVFSRVCWVLSAVLMALSLKQLCANRVIRHCFNNVVLKWNADNALDAGITLDSWWLSENTVGGTCDLSPGHLFEVLRHFMRTVYGRNYDRVVNSVHLQSEEFVSRKELVIPDGVVDLLSNTFYEAYDEVMRWVRKHDRLMKPALKRGFVIPLSILQWYQHGAVCDWLTAWYLVFGHDWDVVESDPICSGSDLFPADLCFLFAAFYCFDDFFIANRIPLDFVQYQATSIDDLVMDCIELLTGSASVELAQYWFEVAASKGFCVMARRLWSLYPVICKRGSCDILTSLYLHALLESDAVCVDYISSRVGLGQSALAASVLKFIAKWFIGRHPASCCRLLRDFSRLVSPFEFCGPAPFSPAILTPTHLPPPPMICAALGIYLPLPPPPQPCSPVGSTFYSPCPSPTPPPSPADVGCECEAKSTVGEANAIVLAAYNLLLKNPHERLWRTVFLALKSYGLALLDSVLQHDDFGLFRFACDRGDVKLVQSVLTLASDCLRHEMLAFQDFFAFRQACELGSIRLIRTLNFFSSPFLWAQALENCDWFRLCCAAGRISALVFLSSFCSVQNWKLLCARHLGRNNASVTYLYRPDVVHFLAVESLKMDLILAGCFY